MRRAGWLGMVLVATCLSLGACDSGDKVDTSKLEQSFSSAQPASKSAIDELKAAVGDKDYAKAGAALQKLASSATLTSEQKEAIQDVAAQLKEKMSEKAEEVAKEGGKALDDIKKQMGR